MTDDTKSAAN